MHFGSPWALLVLVALPFFIFLSRKSLSGLEKGRSIAGTALRSILYVALALALADAHWVTHSRRTATIFLLDHSYSIPHDVQRQAMEWIQKRLAELPKEDAAGVILFGREAMIETPPHLQPKFEGIQSVVTRTATDLGAAVRLALAVFPEGYQRRIVVVSDGNENRGHAVAEAENARAHGAVIDVLPLHYEYPNEVWIEALHVPQEILPKEPFEVTVVVNSQREGPAKLVLRRNNEVLLVQEVRLTRGKNVFTLPQKVALTGSYDYKASIEMAGDTVSQNNLAQAFATARGEARVALVPGEPVDGEELSKALREEGLNVHTFAPEIVPQMLADPGAYDVILFSNVGASQVSRATLEAVEAAVRHAGVGFVMVGGERSFGPGGYRGSPIEELLPVTMEQPQKRVMPNGALCLILHTCEIPEGNFWAKQIGKAALQVLGPQDYMGVVMYGMGVQWLFPMQKVTDRGRLAGIIEGAAPGDMPDFDSAFQMAHTGLKPVTAAAKHIVVISDADPSGPTKSVVDAIIADNITISTIVIHPHGASDIDKMQVIAEHAKGRFYHVQDPNTLPQIFIKEAATVQRSMIIEGRIPAIVLAHSDAIKGIGSDEFPLLYGYTLTNPKPLSRVSLGAPIEPDKSEGEKAVFDPILAEWQHGLGRTVAFTSDAKKRWAKDWVGWEKYKKFWSQTVRSVLRSVQRSPYTLHTEIEGGKGKVVVDALDEQGRPIHTLQFKGAATLPDGEQTELTFRQVGPGRYEAEFEAGDIGVYSVSGQFEGAQQEKGVFSQSVPLSYVPEYRDLKTNVALLNQLHLRTGGRKLGAETPVYVELPEAAGISTPLWPWLLMFLLALWPIDIFIRRVAIEWGPVFASLGAMLRFRSPAAKPAEMPATFQALAAKKKEVRLERMAGPSSPVDLGPGAPGTRASSAPPAARPAASPPAPAPKPAEGKDDDYLKRLLEAKRKARPKEP